MTRASSLVLLAVVVVSTNGQTCPPVTVSDEPELSHVDMHNWESVGCGNWVVQPNGFDVVQTTNMGCPAFFTSPEEHINVIISGSITVNSKTDDDMIGFIMGAKSPSLERPMSYDLTLLDWKKWSECTAVEGKTPWDVESTPNADPDEVACGSNSKAKYVPSQTPLNRMPEGFLLTKYDAKCKCNSVYKDMWSSARPSDKFVNPSACEPGATLDCGVCERGQYGVVASRIGISPADCQEGGPTSPGVVMDMFWDHDLSNGVGTELGRHIGANKGWRENTQYQFRILYTEKRIKVVVDGGVYDWQTVIEFAAPEGSPNQAGKIGFYGMSQDQVVYGEVMTVDIDLDALTPVAKTDVYSFLQVGSTLTKSAAQGLLSNDFDPTLSKLTLLVNGAAVTAKTTFNTSNGGQMEVSPDGSFVYIRGTGRPAYDLLNYTIRNEDKLVSSPAQVLINFPPPEVADIIYTPNPDLPHPLRDGAVLGSVKAVDADGNEICNPVLTMVDTSDNTFRLENGKVILNNEKGVLPEDKTVTYDGAFTAAVSANGKPFGPTPADILVVPPPAMDCAVSSAQYEAPCGPPGSPVYTELSQYLATTPIPAACHADWEAIKDVDHASLYMNFAAGEANLKPQPGDKMGDANQFVWSEISRKFNDNGMNGCFVRFFTSTVCTTTAQKLDAKFIHDDEFWVYMDGALIHNESGWSHKPKNLPVQIDLKAGCNHLVFKIHNGGGPDRFGFSISPTDCSAKVTFGPYDVTGTEPKCLQDCVVDDWSEWSVCEQQEHYRSRTVVKQAAYGGIPCPESGLLTEKASCSVCDMPPEPVPVIKPTFEVVMELFNDQSSGNFTARNYSWDNVTTWMVTTSNGQFWNFQNADVAVESWNLACYMSVSDAGTTIAYEAALYIPGCDLRQQMPGSSVIPQRGDDDFGVPSEGSNPSPPTGPNPSPPTSSSSDADDAADCSLSGVINSGPCNVALIDLPLICPADAPGDGMHSNGIAWCAISIPTCWPDGVNLTSTSPDHQIYHRFYDPNTKQLAIGVGPKEGVADAPKTAKLNMTLGDQFVQSAEYTIGEPADDCEEGGSSLWFLWFVLGMLACCIPLAAYMAYLKYNSVKQDGDTWNTSGKASAAGDADQYQSMGEGGM